MEINNIVHFVFYKKILILCLFILFTGCPDENPIKPGDIIPEETVIEQKSAIIGISGGEIKLSDGTTLTINAGGSEDNNKISVSKLANEMYFSGPNHICISLGSEKTLNSITLKIKVPEGLTSESIGIFRYNPDDIDSVITGDTPEFEYDSINGFITSTLIVTTNGTKKEKIQNSLTLPRWIVEWDKLNQSEFKGTVIPMPFYEQPGNSCWATCATMLAKAYTPYTDRMNEPEVYKFLKYMQIGRDDGISSYNFLKKLPMAIHLYSGGVGLESSGYFRLNSAKEQILNELDKGHPVLISLDYPNVGAHVVMIVGYSQYIENSVKHFYLVVHNPQATGSESMYKIHDFNWVFQNKSLQMAIQIMYPKEKPHNERSLLTLGLPLEGRVGYLRFKVPFKTSQYYVDFKEDITTKKGYSWSKGGVAMLSIPDSASELRLNLPIWNSDTAKPKNATLEIQIQRKGKTVYQYSKKINIPVSKEPVWFMDTIPVSDIRGFSDSSEYYFNFELFDGETYADGYEFYVNIDAKTIVGAPFTFNKDVDGIIGDGNPMAQKFSGIFSYKKATISKTGVSYNNSVASFPEAIVNVHVDFPSSEPCFVDSLTVICNAPEEIETGYLESPFSDGSRYVKYRWLKFFPDQQQDRATFKVSKRLTVNAGWNAPHQYGSASVERTAYLMSMEKMWTDTITYRLSVWFKPK
ncbi:MAG: papain-like cysteine protease family protein [bacterium]